MLKRLLVSLFVGLGLLLGARTDPPCRDRSCPQGYRCTGV